MVTRKKTTDPKQAPVSKELKGPALTSVPLPPDLNSHPGGEVYPGMPPSLEHQNGMDDGMPRSSPVAYLLVDISNLSKARVIPIQAVEADSESPIVYKYAALDGSSGIATLGEDLFFALRHLYAKCGQYWEKQQAVAQKNLQTYSNRVKIFSYAKDQEWGLPPGGRLSEFALPGPDSESQQASSTEE